MSFRILDRQFRAGQGFMFTVVGVYDIFTIKVGSLAHHVTLMGGGGGGREGRGDGFSGHISGFQQFMIFF